MSVVAEINANTSADKVGVSKHPFWLFIGFLAVLVMIKICLYYTYAHVNPFESGVYASATHRIFAGQILYRDFFWMYTPLFILHIVIANLFTNSPFDAEFFGVLVSSVITAVITFLISRRLVRNPVLCLLASMFTLTWADSGIRMLFPSAAILFFSEWVESRSKWSLIKSGFCAGLSTITMQDLGPYIFIASMAAIGAEVLFRQEVAQKPKRAILPVLGCWIKYAAAFGCPILVCVGLLAVNGALPSFYRDCFDIPVHHYMGQHFGHFPLPWELRNDGDIVSKWDAIPAGKVFRWWIYTSPYYVIACTYLIALVATVRSMVSHRWDRYEALKLYLAAFGALAFRTASNIDYVHVEVSSLPAFILLAAQIDTLLQKIKPAKMQSAIAFVVLTFCFVFCFYEPAHRQYHRGDVAVSTIEMGIYPKTGYPMWRELLEVVNFTKANTDPKEAIFCYPTCPMIYVLADRKNATPFDYFDIIMTDEFEDQTIDQLKASRPKLCVYQKNVVLWEKKFGVDYGQKLASWIDTNYVVLKDWEHFTVLKLRTSRSDTHANRNR